MIGISNSIFKTNVKAGGGAPTYDADAQAYFTANTAITSTADKTAINTFYLGLKSDGIYTKIKAMYLPIWGSAASSKWNLVNPLDTNAAYRLTFSTGWTFSSSGATPNGTSAYANTFLNSQLVINSTNHLFYYSRTQTVDLSNACEIGVADSVNAQYNQLRLNVHFASGGVSSITSFSNTTDARGGWLGSKRASNDRETYLNGSTQNTVTTNDTTNNPNYNIYIGARNQPATAPSIALYSAKQCAFASIGDGLTDTQAANLYTRVQTLMTYFGINV